MKKKWLPVLLASHLNLSAACKTAQSVSLSSWDVWDPSVCVCVFKCTSRGVVETDGQGVTEVNGKSAKPKSSIHPPHLSSSPSLPLRLSIHPSIPSPPSPPLPSPLRSHPGCSSLSPSRCPWSCGPARWWTCPLYTSDCSQRHVPAGCGSGKEKDSVYFKWQMDREK